jgi:cytosine/adenosine deaminase-related metal-dependent hydrolase
VNPERALAMKPSKLRQFARDSVQRAQDHGLTQEGPVAMYVQLDLAKGDALRESEASGGLARHGSETQCERMKRIRRALCHLHVK